MSVQLSESSPARRNAPSPARGAVAGLARRPETGALAGTLAVFAVFAVVGGTKFVSAGGIASWLNVAGELGIVSAPVGLLMIAGELDLSVGSVLAASSMTLAIISGYWGAPVIVGVLAALAVGVTTGFLNGVLVTRTRVPSFVVTLASNFGLAGLTLGLSVLITGSTSVSLTTGSLAHDLLGTLVANKFEVAVFWWIAVLLVVGWLLHMSRYGNWIFAIGGDKEGARTIGVPVAKVKIGLFMGTGLCAALVGVIQTILYNSAQVANGQSFVFNSIIAVVIGGVLLTGGYGSVAGVLFGTLTFAIVEQGIYYTSWNSDWANFILGILLLIAVLMNNTVRRLALSYSPLRARKEQGR
jgi:simple sugar transport system permease protein